MNPESFVSALVDCVHEAAINDVVAQLRSPSGRMPPQREVELSQWFGQLSDADRRSLEAVIGRSVHAAIFGTLCVIDGARPIGQSSEHEFQLLSVELDSNTQLNAASSECLHDVYQRLVHQRVFGN